MVSSQLIRQWTLLQELAVSYRGKTMEELGRLLEVGKRTARRDLEAVLRFRDEAGTLRHEQVDEFERSIVGELAESIGAQLRQV